MNPDYVHLSLWQLALSALLILLNILFSRLMQLELEKMLLIASCRMVTQLLLVGFVLKWIFAWDNPFWVVGLALIMATVASVSAVNRTRRRFSMIYWNSFATITVSAFLITGLAMSIVIRVDPWYDPQYVVPLLGMVLGNIINGVSLSLDRFLEDVALRRDQIETFLALGATKWEASHESLKESARAGMIPTINSMMVMGVVSLPGMMTGQILAGANPMDAVNYQIVIVFMIASASALGVIGILIFGVFRLFNRQHQLCPERLLRRR